MLAPSGLPVMLAGGLAPSGLCRCGARPGRVRVRVRVRARLRLGLG